MLGDVVVSSFGAYGGLVAVCTRARGREMRESWLAERMTHNRGMIF
jgi:hypothetical protein